MKNISASLFDTFSRITLILLNLPDRLHLINENSGEMNHLSDIYIAGFSISFIIAALNGISFFYFLYLTDQTVKAHNDEAIKIKRSKFIWVYLISFGTSIGMGLLYLIQYYGQGMAMKPNLLFVVTWRWLFIGVIGAFYMAFLTCILSPGKHHPGQSVFSIFLILLTFLSLYVASISESEPLRIVWSSFTIVWFVMVIAVLFFPHSILIHQWREIRNIVYSEPSVFDLMFRPLKNKSKDSSIKLWSFVLPFILFMQVLIACLGYIITWYLSDGNEFTEVVNFRQTNLSNLIFDMIYIVPLWLVTACLTFHGFVEKVTIIDTRTDHHSIGSSLYSVQTEKKEHPPF